MKPDDRSDLSAMAPAYALGALDIAEEAHFEQALHNSPELQAEVARHREVLSSLGLGLPVSAPPPGLKGRLLERIRLVSSVAPSMANVDFDGLEWTTPPLASGFQIHVCDKDSATGAMTLLLRGDPGASYPDHSHPGGERFVVLQGSFRDHRAEYTTGDYYAYAPGSEHRNVCITGDSPCILLIVTGPGGIEPLETSLGMG